MASGVAGFGVRKSVAIVGFERIGFEHNWSFGTVRAVIDAIKSFAIAVKSIAVAFKFASGSRIPTIDSTISIFAF